MNALPRTLLSIALAAWIASSLPADEPVDDVGAESASHEELEPLAVEFERLSALALQVDGSLLACDHQAKQVKQIAVDGHLTATWSLPFGPEAIDVAADGAIYCGGEGQLAKLAGDGAVLLSAEVPQPEEKEGEPPSQRRLVRFPQRVSGLAVTPSDVFVAYGAGWSLGSKSKLYRFDRELANPKLMAEGLRGCCQRCDIAVHGGTVYLAENSAHRVVAYDREGDVLTKWGQRSRTELAGFGSCCNPMNLAFDAGGSIYTAESGLGRVKQYSTDGEFLGLVGYIGVERFTRASHLAASCSNIAIAVTPDGSRVYVMDFKQNLIRVLQKKG